MAIKSVFISAFWVGSLIAGQPMSAPSIQNLLENSRGFELNFQKDGNVLRGVSIRVLQSTTIDALSKSRSTLRKLSIRKLGISKKEFRNFLSGFNSLDVLRLHLSKNEQVTSTFFNDALIQGNFQTLEVHGIKFPPNFTVSSGTGNSLVSELLLEGTIDGGLNEVLRECRLKSLSLHFSPATAKFSSDGLESIGAQTELESLAVVQGGFRHRRFIDLRGLDKLRALKNLELQHCKIDARHLSEFQQLERLVIRSCIFLNGSLSDIFALPNLKTLTLWECRNNDLHIVAPFDIGDAGNVKQIQLLLPQVADVDAFHAVSAKLQVSLGDYVSFEGKRYLTYPTTRTIHNFGQAEFDAFCMLTNLQGLAFANCGREIVVDERLIKKLARKTGLKVLSLGETKPSGGVPSRAARLRLTGFATQTGAETKFELEQCVVGATLHALILDRIPVSSKGAKGIRQATPTRLGLYGMEFRSMPSDLVPICKNAEFVWLDDCDFTADAFLGLVSACPKLSRLRLTGTGVSASSHLEAEVLESLKVESVVVGNFDFDANWLGADWLSSNKRIKGSGSNSVRHGNSGME